MYLFSFKDFFFFFTTYKLTESVKVVKIVQKGG